MRKVLHLLRSNSLVRAYMVIDDTRLRQLEILKINPEHNQSNVLCGRFPYGAAPSDTLHASVRTMAQALSRMTPESAERHAATLPR